MHPLRWFLTQRGSLCGLLPFLRELFGLAEVRARGADAGFEVSRPQVVEGDPVGFGGPALGWGTVTEIELV